jgi:hypothetical protein
MGMCGSTKPSHIAGEPAEIWSIAPLTNPHAAATAIASASRGPAAVMPLFFKISSSGAEFGAGRAIQIRH